jgi:hypothetical protein
LKLTSDQINAARECGCEFVPATASEVQRLTMQRRIFRIDDQPVLATRNGSYFETIGTLTQMVENHLRDMIRHASAVDSNPAFTPPAPGGRAPVAESASVVPVSAVVGEPNREVVPSSPPPPAAALPEVTVAVEVEPDKSLEVSPEGGAAAGTLAQPKRGRGRPRKHPVVSSNDQKVAFSPERSAPAAAACRPRGPGRPKKEAGMSIDEVEVPVADHELALVGDAPADALSAGDDVPAPQIAPSARLLRVRSPKVPRWMTAGMARRGRLK